MDLVVLQIGSDPYHLKFEVVGTEGSDSWIQKAIGNGRYPRQEGYFKNPCHSLLDDDSIHSSDHVSKLSREHAAVSFNVPERQRHGNIRTCTDSSVGGLSLNTLVLP